MKLYLKATLVTIFLALIFTVLFFKWKKVSVPESKAEIAEQIEILENQGMPDFKSVDIDGKEFRFSDLKGQAVVLNFWASWCGPCLEEFPSMIKMVEELDGRVQLIAVSEDSSVEDVQAFLKAFPKSRNQNIKIILDLNHEIGRLYRAERLPESYIVNGDQKLIRKVVGSTNWASPEAINFLNIAIKK